MYKQTIVLVTLIAIIFATVDNTSTVAAQMKKIGATKAGNSEQKAKAAQASNSKAREAKAREDRERQAKAREAKEREDRARQAKAREAKEREDRARQAKARDAKEREDRARQAKARDAREDKEREDRARQAKARDAREDKEREDRARQAKARDAKEREDRERENRERQAKAHDAKERADKAGIAKARDAKERDDDKRQSNSTDGKDRDAKDRPARGPIPRARVGDPMPAIGGASAAAAREASERREREANEREARERREREADERREREANEREARERREREANEREARERREREARERAEVGRNAAPTAVVPPPSAPGAVDSRCNNYQPKYAYYNQQIAVYEERERNTAPGSMQNYITSRKNTFINDKNKLVTLARSNGCNLSANIASGLAAPPSTLPASGVGRVAVDPKCNNYHFRLKSYNRQIAFYGDKANTATSMMSRDSYLSKKNELINDKSRLIEQARNNGCDLYGSSESDLTTSGQGIMTPPPSASLPSASRAGRAGGDSSCSYYQNKMAEYDREISSSDEKAKAATKPTLRYYWLRRRETHINNKNRTIEAARTKGCM